jgi:hypothetical protein
VRKLWFFIVSSSVLAFGGTACGDPTRGFFDPAMVSDTFEIGVPGIAPAGMASALAITVSGGFIDGPRFPERASDAGNWDFAVGIRDDQIVFLPPRAFGFDDRAGIIGPLAGRTMSDLHDVPSAATFETETPVPVSEGEVYVVRSREFSSGFGGCVQYGKFEPIEVDTEGGVVRIVIETNARCYDTRLVSAGS